MVSVTIGGAATIALSRRRGDIGHAVALLETLSPLWLMAGAALEVGSLVLYSDLQRLMMGNGGVTLRRRQMLGVTLAGNAIANSAPGGPAWSSVWSWSELRRRGIGSGRAGWAIVGAGAFSAVGLTVVFAAAAEAAGDRGPLALLRWPARILVALVLALVVGVVVPRGSAHAGAKGRWRRLEWTREARKIVNDDLRGARTAHGLLLALGNWTLDFVCLAACARAVAGAVPWRAVAGAYVVTQIAIAVPFTPGGLAVVEATLAGLLVAYGVSPGTAAAATLLYRTVSFWVPVPVGWVVWARIEIVKRRTPASGTMTLRTGVEPSALLSGELTPVASADR